MEGNCPTQSSALATRLVVPNALANCAFGASDHRLLPVLHANQRHELPGNLESPAGNRRSGRADDRFIEAPKADKQIVVYGSSKQGKTALVQPYLPYDKNVVVRLTPKTQIADIYASVFRQVGVEIKEGKSTSSGRETSAGVKVGFKAIIPIFGGAEAETKGEAK